VEDLGSNVIQNISGTVNTGNIAILSKVDPTALVGFGNLPEPEQAEIISNSLLTQHEFTTSIVCMQECLLDGQEAADERLIETIKHQVESRIGPIVDQQAKLAETQYQIIDCLKAIKSMMPLLRQGAGLAATAVGLPTGMDIFQEVVSSALDDEKQVTTIVFESVDPQSDDEDRDSIHAATPTPV
jgi:hypothetical protein